MYRMTDYYDKALQGIPFADLREEREEALKLPDLVLESLAESRGLRTDAHIFYRGLPATEEEVRRYYELTPVLRELDRTEPGLLGAFAEALAYLESRWSAGASAEDGEVFLPIRFLKERFALTGSELLGLLLALAAQTDRRYERICAFLQDDMNRTVPETGLLAALLLRIGRAPDETAALTDPAGKLFTWLLESPEGSTGLHRPMVLKPAVLRILRGSTPLEAASAADGIVFPAADPAETAPDGNGGDGDPKGKTGRKRTGTGKRKGRGTDFFPEVSGALRAAIDDGPEGIVGLVTEDADAAMHVLSRAAAGREVWCLKEEDWRDLPEALRAEALCELKLFRRLTDGIGAVFLSEEREGQTAGRPGMSPDGFFARWLSMSAGEPFVLVCPEKEMHGALRLLERAGRGKPMPLRRITLPLPDVSTRAAIWEHDLGKHTDPEVSLPDVADSYEVSYGMIRRICRRLLSEDAGRITRARLLEALTAEDAADFGGLAGRVRTVYRWEDLIIDPAGEQVLKAACDRFRLRNRVGDAWGLKLRNAYGNGVSILLYGPPGTGKTMAAQVVAGEVGLPLYRVDISQIFSKYIGETEKHLSAIFREAQRVNAALFFDEADALFSRRTEVSGSNDKYANAETAHLLQKIEEYSGLTILATNYYGNFDQAFIRRITYAVRLDQPDAAARLKLWQNTLPAEAPLDPSVDFSYFAEQFDCTGSQIKAILYSAAYLAGAEEAGQIGIRHIVRAMRLDFEKQGRLIETAAFGPYARYL